MFSIKLKGPWAPLVGMLKNYDQRVAYVAKRAGRDVAEALLARIISKAPEGEEFRTYIESLKVVELYGSRNRVVFGIISDRGTVKIGEIQDGDTAARTVVYFQPTPKAMGNGAVTFLVMGNPWPLDMVPHGIKDLVSLVHQVVTEGEAKWAKVNSMDVLSKYRASFRSAGIHWGRAVTPEAHASQLASLPDFMSLAIRAEFGINADLQSHWRPAINWVMRNLEQILKQDSKIASALYDSLFRDHTLKRSSGHKRMKIGDFKKEVEEFEKAVVPL